MQNLLTKVKNFVQEEEGASAVEYGLLVALIAVAIIGAVTTLGTNLSTMFNNVATTIQGTAS
jgi:pilus assembly protein Flp/PilA